MKIEKFWCVEDPGPVSEMADICYEVSAGDLVKIVRGTACAGDTHGLRRLEAITAYTDEAEARADAEQRLADRGARADASTSSGACRVWELFSGNMRLFENGLAQHWDADAGKWRAGWSDWGDEDMSPEDERRHDEWEAAAKVYRFRSPA